MGKRLHRPDPVDAFLRQAARLDPRRGGNGAAQRRCLSSSSRNSVNSMADLICRDCGSTDVHAHFGEAALCDRRFDRRVSEHTGFPRLPDRPPPINLTDPDGRSRILRFRLWRAPTGIEVELEEADAAPDEGYHRAVLGSHDADVARLVSRLRELAEADIARHFPEPNRHRPGGAVAGDVVEGRPEWCDDSSSEVVVRYDVIIDGRKLSWEELGRELEGYEGCRFRLQLADRIEDLRPDAVVTPFRSPGLRNMDSDRAASPNIEELLDRFLADQRARLSERTMVNYLSVVDLLRSCLNNYGYQHLDQAAQDRFHAGYENDEDAFVHLFGASELVAGIPEFLGYFMVRKVIAGAELLRAAGTVTKKLAKWLGEGGYVDADDVADVVERGGEAGRDLPRAERLSGILFTLAREAGVDVHGVDDEDYVEDYLTIERVESGALFFEGGVGPLEVPKAASDLARVGWSLYASLARTKQGWQLVEVGVVYP